MAEKTDSQAVVSRNQINNTRALLQACQKEFAVALPKHIKVEQFLRVAMTTLQKNPGLLKCTQSSVLGSLMEAAQLGLQVDGMLGQAYLVPFNNKYKDGAGVERWRMECQLIVGYKGYMVLARNSGEVSHFAGRCVYDNDLLEIEEGLEPKLKYISAKVQPPLEKDEKLDDHIIGAFAVCKFKDGTTSFVFLWKWQIERFRHMSKAPNSKMWREFYPEACEKTAMRRLSKYLPLSAEIMRAESLDTLADMGLEQAFDNVLTEMPGGDGEMGAEPPLLTAGTPGPAGSPGSNLDNLVTEREKATGKTISPAGNAQPGAVQQQSPSNIPPETPWVPDKPGDTRYGTIEADPGLARDLFAKKRTGGEQ